MAKLIAAGLASVAFVAGLALGASSASVAAQPSSAFITGDTISLQYNGVPSRQCQVEVIAGDFVKCRHPQDQTWYNLNATLLVVRCSPIATAGCK